MGKFLGGTRSARLRFSERIDKLKHVGLVSDKLQFVVGFSRFKLAEMNQRGVSAPTAATS